MKYQYSLKRIEAATQNLAKTRSGTLDNMERELDERSLHTRTDEEALHIGRLLGVVYEELVKRKYR